MTNKQAYAETMGRVNEALHDAERFESLSATVRCVDLRALLKRAGELEGVLLDARKAIVAAARDTLWSDDSPAETIVDRIDAALNNDAPLSIGEGL